MNLLAPETIDIVLLPSFPVSQKALLPQIAAIYFVLDAANHVFYIGRTQMLRLRWVAHHRFPQCVDMDNARIAWLAISDVALLPSVEKALIDYFAPAWNDQKVRRGKYVQSTIRVDEELLYEAQYYLSHEKSSVTGFFTEKLREFVDQYRQDHPERVPGGSPPVACKATSATV